MLHVDRRTYRQLTGGVKPSPVTARKPSKFGNVKVTVDGLEFDSSLEAHHYVLLKARQMAGEIGSLEMQPKYDLIVNGQKVCRYIADFRYVDLRSGDLHVVDVKSAFTAQNPTYRLKNKLLRAVTGIEIEEIGFTKKQKKPRAKKASKGRALQ